MTQAALFALSPSQTDVGNAINRHEAYQSFLIAEGQGDAGLLAWAKTWGRPVAEALVDDLMTASEFSVGDDRRASEIRDEANDEVSDSLTKILDEAEVSGADLRPRLRAFLETLAA